MALTADGFDRATVTYLLEAGLGTKVRRLPFAFVQFDNVGEERYVCTLTGDSASGISVVGARPFCVCEEYMRFAAFPHEADRPLGVNQTQDAGKEGPFAVQFIGYE